MNKLSIIAIASALICAGCSSTSTLTESVYDQNGVLVKHTVSENRASDLSNLSQAWAKDGEDCATATSISVAKFGLGYAGVGLDWLSVSAFRVKAPVASEGGVASSSEAALKAAAECLKASQISLKAGDVSVNGGD